MVPFDSNISVDAPEKEWVSRGAHKLIRALITLISTLQV